MPSLQRPATFRAEQTRLIGRLAVVLDPLPIQTESCQILSQAVGIVRDLLGLARGVEQFTSGFRECAAALAN